MDNVYSDICTNCGGYYEKDSSTGYFIKQCLCGNPYSHNSFPKELLDVKNSGKIIDKIRIGDFELIIKQTHDYYSGILRYKNGGSFIISKSFNRKETEILNKRVLFRFFKEIEKMLYEPRK